MTVFPWLVLLVLVLAISVGLLRVAARLWVMRTHHPAPFAVGLVSSLLVALPILLLVLAWGLLLKPR